MNSTGLMEIRIHADMPVLDEDDIADENITLLYQSESDEEDFDD